MKKTIKQILLEKFLLTPREIEIFFLAKKIFYKNEIVINLAKKIDDSEQLIIKNFSKEYVSRGAYKLLEAFEKFNLSVDNLVALDIGSSTGGFTEVLLQKNAKLVYALDVGTNQLDYKLRNDSRVISLEKTNLKTINKNLFENEIEFVCCDVSFISLKHVFKVLNFLKEKVKIVLLIKPQFEASKDQVSPGGFVKTIFHQQIIDTVLAYANKDFTFYGLIKSPIRGNKSKNIEYLAFFEKN